MSVTIKLIGSASGESTKHDGRYLVEYTPARMDANGYYMAGGRLITTDDITQAKHFESAAEALSLLRATNGFRPDGKPNRPLMAWTTEIAHAD